MTSRYWEVEARLGFVACHATSPRLGNDIRKTKSYSKE